MNHSSLVLKDVTKRYKPGKAIIENLTMQFTPGDATLLTGPNGSGKTTFLRLLSVSTFPTSGSVTYGEVDIHRTPYKYLKHVGLVGDDESMPLYLTASEILEWILRTRDLWEEKTTGGVVLEMLRRLQLSDARDEQLGTYSTGMKKKVQIAAAFIVEPDLLILDEPLRGLDKQTRQTVLSMIREKVDEGAICLMASHFGEEVPGGFTRRMTFPLD